jgi:hypothetical protein
MFEPDSTLADVRENYEFLKEMKMLNSPSITAHLLHHKQTVFKGTRDYEKNNGAVGPDSVVMYERPCKFKDKAVEALSENINAFCLKILKDLSLNRNSKSEERGSCVYDEDDTFSKQKNEQLIEYFEQTLCSYE